MTSTSSTSAIIAGMTTDLAGFVAYDYAADRVPLLGGMSSQSVRELDQVRPNHVVHPKAPKVVSKLVSISPRPVRRLSETNQPGACLDHVCQCRFALRQLPPGR